MATDTASEQSEIPDVLREVIPHVGEIWEWEPLNDQCRATLKVTDVKWNGEEAWVQFQDLHKPHAEPNWVELGHWVQATVLIDPVDD